MKRPLNPLAPLMTWRRKDAKAEKLYGAIVAQARLSVFYQAFGVPDRLEGRFLILTLHLFAVLHRLRMDSEQTFALSQELIDTFTADMETVLREIGVGDLAIPKKVRGLAAKSAALLHGYELAFTKSDEAFTAVLAEMLPLDGDDAKAVGGRLASYVKEAVDCLATQPVAALTAGEIKFPAISDASGRRRGDRLHE